ncbi:hydrolase [Pseudoramibacter sp.]|jgi:2-keto-3-deoxy-6-phosphogluconate aldolase|uniref:hydrolase n=1 Tax=Pseudoramibacter sp. TaxID=2034862 RepID=UPI0025DE820D|nr:hydrolase [Pseudoramibacter sp.]MCH4072955.1 hydrolase [Pseudoramibacter sp.]MCH4106726.1 hydrolase [Pseudoramibacter sp.]
MTEKKLLDSPNSEKNPSRKTPNIQTKLRHQILHMPEIIQEASGIRIYGRTIKSIIFTTDLAIIKNCDADAVFAVYPFTPQQSISDAIIKASSIPVFCGCGGGTTRGLRTISLAKDVECQGAFGVVLNSPITNANLKAVSSSIDIPTIITVVSPKTNIEARINAGAAILNVAGGKNTRNIVSRIRETHPDIPIIATGGNTKSDILSTIDAGANAVTITPPSTADLFTEMMNNYRENADQYLHNDDKGFAQLVYEYVSKAHSDRHHS